MNGPVALVTGASGDIGSEIACQLARDGFGVVIHYHTRRERADQVRDVIAGAGGEAVVRGFDVSDGQAVAGAVKEIATAEGPIHVLVNNAATIRDHLLMRMSREAWHQVVDTDLTGLFNCTQAVLTTMAAQRRRGRRIINITSVVGQTGNVGQANYAAAKAGIIGFTKSIARELAPMGITVNAIAPGFIETDVTKHLSLEKLVGRIPLGRLGRPEEIASVVSFLASERAAYITGQIVGVNGGLFM